MFTRNPRGQFTKTLFPKADKVFENFASNVINTARANLNKKGKRNTALGKSLSADTIQKNKNFALRFWANDYSEFVDEGVGGAGQQTTTKSGRSLGIRRSKPNKAPLSPFSYKTKYPPRSALDRWAVKKNIKGTRDKEGRFIKRKSMMYLIQRSIFEYGIAPTYFFSNSFAKYFTPKFISDVETAYADDIETEWEKDIQNQIIKT